MSELNVSAVDAAPAANVEPQSQTTSIPAESVKTESAPVQQEQTTPEKPKQSPEENARFAEVRRKAQAEADAKAQDAVIERLYGKTHGIHTMAEYEAAVAEENARAEAAKIAADNAIPEPIAKELYESRKEREERQKSEKEAAEKAAETERKNAEYAAFFDLFKRENGRDFDANTDNLPQDVWDAVKAGTPIKYAYMEHRLSQLRAGTKAIEQNAKAAEADTGSVIGNGPAEGADHITEESFEAHRSDAGWVRKNLDKINKSRMKWK